MYTGEQLEAGIQKVFILKDNEALVLSAVDDFTDTSVKGQYINTVIIISHSIIIINIIIHCIIIVSLYTIIVSIHNYCILP